MVNVFFFKCFKFSLHNTNFEPLIHIYTLCRTKLDAKKILYFCLDCKHNVHEPDTLRHSHHPQHTHLPGTKKVTLRMDTLRISTP